MHTAIILNELLKGNELLNVVEEEEDTESSSRFMTD